MGIELGENRQFHRCVAHENVGQQEAEEELRCRVENGRKTKKDPIMLMKEWKAKRGRQATWSVHKDLNML